MASKSKQPQDFEVVAKDGLHDGECRRPGCIFVTRQWPTAKAAAHRIAEHIAEHDHGTPMSDMQEFCGTHAPELVQR